MRPLASLLGLVLLAGCVSSEQSLTPVDSANYELDPAHAFLSARVTHFGISDYVIDLTGFDAQLDFVAEDPVRSRISVQIDPMALDTHYPDPERKAEWEADLSNGARFLDGEAHPDIAFVSVSAERTGEFTGRLTGELKLRGIVRPVTLDVTYNGTATSPLDNGRRRLGFSASGSFNRSDFGMNALTQFVSDEVRIEFAGEFIEAG